MTNAAAVARADRAVHRGVAPISQSTAELLDQVWAAMLARVRYPAAGGVLMTDGTAYHVSHFQYGVAVETYLIREAKELLARLKTQPSTVGQYANAAPIGDA